jgi:hypothetical protein
VITHSQSASVDPLSRTVKGQSIYLTGTRESLWRLVRSGGVEARHLPGSPTCGLPSRSDPLSDRRRLAGENMLEPSVLRHPRPLSESANMVYTVGRAWVMA